MTADVRARVVYLAEAIEAGDYGLAGDIARDLLDDYAIRPEARCPDCGIRFDAPGQIPAHLSNVHGRVA